MMRDDLQFKKELNREIAMLKVIKELYKKETQQEQEQHHPNIVSLEKAFLNDGAKCLNRQTCGTIGKVGG